MKIYTLLLVSLYLFPSDLYAQVSLENKSPIDPQDVEAVFLGKGMVKPYSARPEFFAAFKKAQELVVENKPEQAKRAIADLHKIKTLNAYEKARIHLIDYWYYGMIGEKDNETNALMQLIPIGAGNVDPKVFVEAGIRLFKRQYNSQDYGNAIDTLNYLRKVPQSEEELHAIDTAVKKMDAIANSTQNISQQIKIGSNGQWLTKLLKHVFFIEKLNGEIINSTLICENNQTQIPYQADSMVTVPSNWEACSINITATPNTTFHFVQVAK